ncbi:unnamed protein product [Musa hybrid cultivar]
MTNPNNHANGDHHSNRPYPPPEARRQRLYVGPSISTSSSAASFKGCCCCLFLLLTFFALLAVAIALVVVLVLKPKKPQFDLQQVVVQYLLVAPAASAIGATVGGGGASSPAAYLSLNITLLLMADNPNKVGIRYEAAALDVMYRGLPLGVATVPRFEQPARSRRLVQTRVVVDRFNVLQSDALNLVRDAALNDRVDLRLTGDVAAKILLFGIPTPRVQRKEQVGRMEGGCSSAPFSVSLAFFLLLSFILFYFNYAFATVNILLLSSACLVFISLLLGWSRFLKLRAARKDVSVRWFVGEDVVGRASNRGCMIGKAASEGVMFFGNGDTYEGELHKGWCHGSGVYCFNASGRYEGDWVDGKYDGHGIESWARGSRYRGQYRQGARHGFGVYRFYDGDSYSGEWVIGQSHGSGMQTCSDGSCYAGEFKCGVKHGLGRYRFRNGDTYSGEYFGDKIHGFGVYSFVNGHCYEGSWHEGRRQGLGTYTFGNGDSRSGEWDCGILKNSFLATDPAVERAVEAAKKAAESCVLLPQAEEQVKHAVSAANKAAMAARVAAVRAAQNEKEDKFCDIYV